MDNERVLIKNIDEISKPYTEIDIRNYDKLYIEGFNFPLPDGKENNPLKPPLEREQLVDKLRSHGVVIQPDEEELAKNFIFKTNYYKLSIFTRYLSSDLSFKSLIDLYNFDRFLSESLSTLVSQIEIYLKASLANFLSVNYSKYTKMEEGERTFPSLAYLDLTLYKPGEVKNKEVHRLLSKFSQSLNSKRGKDLTIDHHIKNYGGNIPIWVLVEHLTLGEFSMLITKLNRVIVKDWIAQDVPLSWQKALSEWINTVRILRNACAHNNRMYATYFTYSPIIPESEKENFIFGEQITPKEKESIKSTLFAGLLIMKLFYHSLGEEEQERWNNFINRLNYEINTNDTIKIERMGFPLNWLELLTFVLEA